jgi:hypothetical protein
MPLEFRERCDIIEGCYEFMLAYAGQGLPSEEGRQSGAQVREFLQGAVRALTGLADSCEQAVEEEGLEGTEKYRALFFVVGRDAHDALAALDLVLAQLAISSQLIDNLNASIHLRALLTDLFLIGEVLRMRRKPQPAVTG